jgi:hypothetical protein
MTASARDNNHPEPQKENRPQGSHSAVAPQVARHHDWVTWTLGGLLLALIVGAFMFAPRTLPEFKHRLLAICAALLAGFFAYFLAGNIRLEIKILKSHIGELSLRATSGLATFALVLIWWLSPLAPIANQKTQPDAGHALSLFESGSALGTKTDNDELSTISSGSRVLANWKGTDSFYPGVVLKTNNKKYYVAYDSSAEEWIDKTSLVLFKIAKGSKLDPGTEVYALVDEPRKEWLPAIVKAIKGGQYLVSYQNHGGLRHKWIPIDSIILRKK